METKYGDISPRTAGFATRKLLERGQHLLVFERFGQVDPQGKNKTDTRKYRRYLNLPRAVAPLAEGVTPAGHKLTHQDISITLEQYGDLVRVSDKIVDTHEDPVLDEAIKICGEQAAETIEVIRFNAIKGGTNVYYSGSAATRATVSDTIKRTDIRRIVRGFARAKARKISEIVKASAMISTQPVEAAYFAVCHTDLIPDIRNLTGFVPVAQYSASIVAMPGEVGTCEDVRFIATALIEPWLAAGASTTDKLTNGAAGSAACDVYPVLFFARDCYAIVPLQGGSAIEIGAVSPGKKTNEDPLGQKGFVSWKAWQAAVILNQSWLARLECAATSAP